MILLLMHISQFVLLIFWLKIDQIVTLVNWMEKSDKVFNNLPRRTYQYKQPKNILSSLKKRLTTLEWLDS